MVQCYRTTVPLPKVEEILTLKQPFAKMFLDKLLNLFLQILTLWMDTQVIAWAVVATTCYHEHMHKNTLGDAEKKKKNHRSLLIVPLSRRSRVGRLCYICVRSAAVSAHRRAVVPLCRWTAWPRPPPTLAEQQNLSPRWRRESPRESIRS